VKFRSPLGRPICLKAVDIVKITGFDL